MIKTLARWKIYLDRGRLYMMYCQFAMIAVVFTKSVSGHPWFSWAHGHTATITICIVLGLVVMCAAFGWADSKIGIRREEWLEIMRPTIDEIVKGVKR